MVGATISTLLDALADWVNSRVGTGESEASLSFGASHREFGLSAKHSRPEKLSDRFFYIQPLDENCVKFL